MKTGTNVPDVKVIFKEIMEAPEQMFDMFRIDMRQACERAVTELIKVELSGFLSFIKPYWEGKYYRQRFHQKTIN